MTRTAESPRLLWTADAVAAIRDLWGDEGRPEAAFRIDVMLGGCKGFKLAFRLDDQYEDDVVFSDGAVRILVQRDAMPLVEGALLDYENSHRGTGFRLAVPAATNACGCGTSFGAIFPGEPIPGSVEGGAGADIGLRLN